MTYEESERIVLLTAKHLIKIYFEGVDREKVSAQEMLFQCPNFMKEAWDLLVSRIIK